MSKKNLQKQDGLEKILRYILGVRPDEFGLHPDEDGFVSMKNLLAAFHDEEGWRGVREGQIMMLTNQPGDSSPFEAGERGLRLKPALAALPPEAPDQSALPKTLFLPLKPSAWPVIHEKGLFPKIEETMVQLWAEKEMAEKIGRRFSPAPVLVTVQAVAARKAGAEFTPYSDLLWLTAKVDTAFLIGPPVPPKEEAPVRKVKEKTTEPAGSFHVAVPEPEVHRGKKKGRYGDAPDWKNQIRRDRRRHGDD